MNPKQKYKNQRAAIKSLLQEYDPLNYLVKYAGERFEKQLYAYEAGTILEKFRNLSNNSEIEDYLINSSKSKDEVNIEAAKNVSIQIGNVINGF